MKKPASVTVTININVAGPRFDPRTTAAEVFRLLMLHSVGRPLA